MFRSTQKLFLLCYDFFSCHIRFLCVSHIIFVKIAVLSNSQIYFFHNRRFEKFKILDFSEPPCYLKFVFKSIIVL